MPEMYEIKSDAVLGRHLIANQIINQGEIIMDESPLIVFPPEYVLPSSAKNVIARWIEKQRVEYKIECNGVPETIASFMGSSTEVKSTWLTWFYHPKTGPKYDAFISLGSEFYALLSAVGKVDPEELAITFLVFHVNGHSYKKTSRALSNMGQCLPIRVIPTLTIRLIPATLSPDQAV